MGIAWGIDVGVASLGFAVIDLDANGQPLDLIDGVSHVYAVPTGGADRRLYRSMRTQTQRRAARLKDLRRHLADLLGIDPTFDQAAPRKGESRDQSNGGLSRVRLRAVGLDGALSAEDLARAIMHIARNRGRRLTRGLKGDDAADASGSEGDAAGATKAKADAKGARKETVLQAAKRTEQALADLARTLQTEGATPGQLLWMREQDGKPTRLSKRTADAPMFTRRMMEDELDRLVTAQAKYHPALTQAARTALMERVFKEEDPQPPNVGPCRYGVEGPDGQVERRRAIASDLFQTKRILEELAHLVTLTDPWTGAKTPLTLAQRDSLLDIAMTGEDLTVAGIRKALGLGTGANAPILGLQATGRNRGGKGRKTDTRIAGHALARAFRDAGQADLWRTATPEQRTRLSEALRTVDDYEDLIEDLMRDFGLTEQAATRLAHARVPAGYSAAGPTATRLIADVLRAEVIPVSEAVARAGLDDAVGLKEHVPRGAPLPYYGEVLHDQCVVDTRDLKRDPTPSDPPEVRFGRIPNPVVHAALNRIRKVANDYLKRYGPPDRICLELARDMNKSVEEREKVERDNFKRQKENDRYAKALITEGLPATRDNLRKMRLWEWQRHKCLYSGKTISMHHFKEDVDTDHILPRAQTLDDRMGNLALCFRWANAHKSRRTPYEAFSQGEGLKDCPNKEYAHILQQVEETRPGSLWRFQPDALERFKDQGHFQERFLNDTRYIGKLARAYLARLVPQDSDVLCLTGGITAALRKHWGLSTLIRDIMIEEGRLDPALFEDQGDPPEAESEREAHADALAQRVRLRSKIRWDDRHHLLDAIVAGCVTRSDVQRLHTMTARGIAEHDRANILADIRKGIAGQPCAGVCWDPQTFPARVKAFLTEVTPERPTRVTLKPDHDPRGQLHQQTQYRVVCENPKAPGKFVTIAHQDIEGLAGQYRTRTDFIETLDRRLGLNAEVRAAVEAAAQKGERLWWGGHDPVSDLNNLARSNERLKQALLAAWDRAAETPDEKGKPKTATVLAREAVARVMADTKQHRYSQIAHQQVRILGENRKGRPSKAYVTGSNHCLVCFRTEAGDRDIEITATFDANDPNHVPRWVQRGGDHLFTFHRDDLVEMDVPADDGQSGQAMSGRAIYRVGPISGNDVAIDVECFPVPESRSRKQVPPNVCRRFGGKKGKADFLAARPTPVYLTPTGYLKWKPPAGN